MPEHDVVTVTIWETGDRTVHVARCPCGWASDKTTDRSLATAQASNHRHARGREDDGRIGDLADSSA